MKARFILSIAAALFIALPLMADEHIGPVGKMTLSSAAVEWQSAGSFERLVLVVSTPNGATFTREFQGPRAQFRLADLAPRLIADGTYVYELRAVPKLSAEVKQRLAAARAKDDDEAIANIKAEAGIGEPIVQAGAFSVREGSFVIGGAEAPAPGKTPKVTSNAVAGAPGKLTPAPNDVVTADDAIIQGSLCVGLDCVNNESFGFDTIRLKENNTRIKFDDTSTTAGCPNNDWQLTANDACGGANKFSIEDITGAKVPFTITAGAPTNSVFVASSGKVGFGNSSPGLNLHITATDTPAIRQEQTNGGGFTAWTWDIGANEANWFVRDLTSGSRLPFRIRPGAPTSSIDIAADGKVGIGTASPASQTHILTGTLNGLRVESSNSGFLEVGKTSATRWRWANDYNAANILELLVGLSGGDPTASLLTVTTTGRVGIGTTNPAAQLSIVNGASSSTVNAGSSTFTTTSSRTFKENIEPVVANNILEKIEATPVVTYDFINGGPKNRMGLIAEDFYKVFGRGDDKHIDGQDVEMALWLAVQKLTAENKALTDRLAQIEKQLEKKQ
ncbi:MAG TPA: tail fiber domain-containing protein [Thermoanaerobaculia bacterium]|jgi:hypothetical protein